VIWGACRPVTGAPSCSRLVVGEPSYSDSRQECPARVWYSPEIDASKFTLHILSDTPWGFQRLKFILLMWQPVYKCHWIVCNCNHPKLWSMILLGPMVLTLCSSTMVFLPIPGHLYIFPLFPASSVGVTSQSEKLPWAELRLLQVDWHIAFWTGQIWQIMALSIRMVSIVGQIRYCRQVLYLYKNDCQYFNCWMKRFRPEIYRGLTKCTTMTF
jgi:hypothetical protein